MAGARRRGRSRTAWMDNIKTWTGLSVEESIRKRNTHTHTRLTAFFSGTTRVGRYQKGKTNLDFIEAKDSSGSGISWAICKSAPRCRQITTPAHHHSSFFTGRMPFLPPNQQRQSTEGHSIRVRKDRDKWRKYVHGVANPRIENGHGTEQNRQVYDSRHLQADCQ